MADVDLSGYYRLLAVVCPPRPKARTAAHAPTLDRTKVRGRVLAMIQRADSD